MPGWFRSTCRKVRGFGLITALVLAAFGAPLPGAAAGESKATPVRLKVLVAQIDGVEGPLTRHLVRTLKETFPAGSGISGIDVTVVPLPNRLPRDRTKAKYMALLVHARILTLLKRQSADLLIRGRALPDGGGYRLQFIPGKRLAANLSRFPVHLLDLPAGFDGGHAAALSGALVLAGSAAAPDRGRYLTERLPPLIKQIRTAFKVTPDSRHPSVSLIYGNMAMTLGQLTADKAMLEEAVSAYRTVVKQWTRERRPWEWAQTQMGLGEAFRNLHDLDPQNPRVADAVAAFRNALTVYTREKTPAQWAALQGFLGGALIQLAELEEDTASLHEAVAALRGSMEIITRERMPEQWSWFQGALGTALLNLGLREKDDASIEAAVKAFRDALEEFGREGAPGKWAASLQNQLGVALATLDGRQEEAVAAFRACLTGLDRKNQPALWGSTQVQLGLVLSQMAQREKSADRHRESIAAFRAGLSVITRAGKPHLWADTQSSLGVALHFLGLMEDDKAMIAEAADAYRAALQVHTRKLTPAEWAGDWNNLGEAYGNIGEREKDPAQIAKGITLIREALEVWTRKDMPEKWAYGSEQLATFLVKLTEHGGGRTGLKEAISVLNEVIAYHDGTGGKEKAAELRELLARAKSL